MTFSRLRSLATLAFRGLRKNEHFNTRFYCSDSETKNYGAFDLKMYSNIMTSPEAEKDIKMILLEYELAKQYNLRVPSEISEKHMAYLMTVNQTNARQRYFHYLGTVELKKNSVKLKKEERKKEYEKMLEERIRNPSSEHIEYGLGKNSLLPSVYKISMDKSSLSHLIHAATMEQPLIVDLSFEDAMTDREIRNLARQLQQAYGANRKNKDPFDLCFCNAHPESKLIENVKLFIPNLFCPTSMVTIDKRDYSEVYPKEKLVYLTPDSKNVLHEFQSDKIYIIGGIVDTGSQKPLTLAKAKRQGIQTAKFPLEKHLIWHRGRKSLTLNQVTEILLEWKRTNDWNKALQFVPTRFLKKAEDLAQEEQAKKMRYVNPERRFLTHKVANWFN